MIHSSYIVGYLFLYLRVIVHEFGHYFFSKRYNCDITEFSIGTHTLFSVYTSSGMKISFGAIPLTGYVRHSVVSSVNYYRYFMICFSGFLFESFLYFYLYFNSFHFYGLDLSLVQSLVFGAIIGFFIPYPKSDFLSIMVLFFHSGFSLGSKRYRFKSKGVTLGKIWCYVFFLAHAAAVGYIFHRMYL